MTNTTRLMLLLLLSIIVAGCITPNEPQQAEPEQPTPDQPDQIDLILKPSATPTATPDHIVEPNTTNNDSSTWSTCDPRHNESWRYSHGCGMYASSGGGGRSSGGCPPCDSCCPPCPPIPELPTAGLMSLGIAVILIARRQS